MKNKKKKELLDVSSQEVIVSKKENRSDIITTLIMVLIGLVLLVLPEETNSLIGYIIGGILMLQGIYIIIKYIKEEIKSSSLNLVSGILFSTLGLIIILNPLSIMKLATLILGVYLIVNGALKSHNAYLIKERYGKWQGLFVAGVIIVLLGIILIINPFSGLIITKVAGVFLIIVATFDAINDFFFKKNI